MAKKMMTDYLQAGNLKAVVAKKLGVVLDVVVHQSVDSTNSWCLRQSKLGKELPFACFAEQQTAGRGRRGKQWLMSSHNNIAMSLTWPFDLSAQSFMSRDGRYSARSQEGGAMNLLPLSIALAIVETLENLGLKQVQVKWPNDVYVQGKKIAGILIETQAIRHGQVSESVTDEKSTNGKPGNNKSGSDKPTNDKQLAVVIGLGLNYQMLKSNQIRSDQMKALVLTDICQQIQSQKIAVKPTRSSVASALLCNVITVCHNFSLVSAENLEKFRDSYDFCKQKEVKIILDNNEVLTGVAQGVNGNAELLVLVAGELRVFNCADVSVRADMSRDGRP